MGTAVSTRGSRCLLEKSEGIGLLRNVAATLDGYPNMTYFGFLGIFLLIPIGLLLFLILWDLNQGRAIPAALRAWPPAAAIALHVIIAVLYMTIWDNYLVAIRVWWYDPAWVTGVIIAYVPIEEYTFFILQPILAGVWLLFFLLTNTLVTFGIILVLAQASHERIRELGNRLRSRAPVTYKQSFDRTSS
jgi:lycopene cyclase domain-containing protein